MHEEQQPAERAQHGPLSGFTVGVTAARRADELGVLLQRRGAVVVHAPALRIVPLADDSELLAATKELIDQAPDVVVATTAIGFRGWIEAADGWGLGEALLDRLRGVELLARGPKVKGAVRAAGLTEEWSPSSESMAEVLDRLLEEGVEGRRVADPAARRTPARVRGVAAGRGSGRRRRPRVPVDAARGHRPAGPAPRRHGLPRPGRADVHQRTGRRVAALPRRDPGPAARTPRRPAPRRPPGLRRPRHRAPAPEPRHRTVQPERFRLGPLVQLLCQELPGRARTLPIAGHRVEIRGHAVLVDGALRPVPPAGMSLLRALSRRPGWVVARAELLRALPGAGRDEHAVETAMARLRTALGSPKLIQTVVKRGYRLALDPAADTKYSDV
jgi:uroporphyrinogen-III synthase